MHIGRQIIISIFANIISLFLGVVGVKILTNTFEMFKGNIRQTSYPRYQKRCAVKVGNCYLKDVTFYNPKGR